MVATGTVEEPSERRAHKGIRTHLKLRLTCAHRRRRWHVGGSLWDTNCLSGRTDSAAEASCRVRTNLRPGHVSVHATQNVIGLAAHVAYLQHEVVRDAPFHR